MNEPLDTKDLRSLLNVLHYDAGRRYEILREELAHLVNSIRYRLDADRGSDDTWLAPSNSHKAFLKRIEESAQALYEECCKEAEAGVQLFERSRKDWVAAMQPGRPGGDHLEPACRAVLFNARFVNKALALAERMGDLHDRLEQFLQRTNPDHPDPTLRRRF